MEHNKMISDHVVSSCTSYAACGMWFQLGEINWGTVGASVLLIARLAKDVPDAIRSIRAYFKKPEPKKIKRKKKKK